VVPYAFSTMQYSQLQRKLDKILQYAVHWSDISNYNMLKSSPYFLFCTDTKDTPR
jgi:hypothetical protein